MSSLPSFFLSPNAFHGVFDRVVTIHDAAIIRQMRKVLRLKPGDLFIALDGERHEYTCRIDAFDRDRVRTTIMQEAVSTRETRVPITLYASLIRRERFALLLEKCTELGVSRFSPIAAARSPFHEITPHLRQRWEHIIREAAEVARRGVLPALAPVATLAVALAAIPSDEQVIVLSTAHTGAKTAKDIPTITRGVKRIHLFLGPEGDYTEEEYGLFNERGAIPFSLGSRIVRSETAAIAAVSIITASL